MIDVRAARAHRMREREHFAARAGAANSTVGAHGRVDHVFQTDDLPATIGSALRAFRRRSG